jgi:hypothetical protein
MKLPKNFNKLSLPEQEKILVEKWFVVQDEADKIARMLASVRGGYRVRVSDEDRPDELLLKNAS